MNKENDKEKVIDLAYKYIVEKMKYDLKSDEADHLKRIITPFVKDVTSLELFNFFPFEIMTPEMLAEFCAEHLIMRGAANLKDNDPYVNEDKSAAAKSKGKSTTANSKDKSTTDDNKNKNASDGSKDKSTNLRQIMDNLRKGRYGSLIESGAVDSFIINKEELENFLPKDYDGTVPDYIDDCFIDYSNYFKDVVLLLGNRSSVSDFINCRRMIEDLKRKYLIFFKFDRFPLILFLVNEDDHIGVVNQQQRILKCMVDIVNYLILETMTLFIMDKNWYKLFRIKKNPEHINALFSKNELSLMSFKDYHSKIHGKVDNSNISLDLDNLSEYIDAKIEKPIDSVVKTYRKKWLEKNQNRTNKAMTQALSLKFAYYLHGVIIDGYKYDTVKNFNETDIKENNAYNEEFEALSHIPGEQNKYVSESNNPRVRACDYERCVDIANMFYPTNGFDARDKDFIHIVKIFYQELYVHPVCIRDKKGNRILARKIFVDKGNLPLNQEIFLQMALDHAHFRQKRQLDVYRKYYDVLNKLWKITEKSYLTLDLSTGLNVIRQILFKYLKFYDDFS